MGTAKCGNARQRTGKHTVKTQAEAEFQLGPLRSLDQVFDLKSLAGIMFPTNK